MNNNFIFSNLSVIFLIQNVLKIKCSIPTETAIYRHRFLSIYQNKGIEPEQN
jgi:hypothetical protein